MKINKRLKTTLLWIIRWILYIPTILLVISLVKILILGIIANLQWWIAIPLWSFLGIGPLLCGGSVFGTGLICPNRKIGNLLFLGIFLIAEISSFYNEFGISTALENILRFGSNFYIIIGFLFAAFWEFETKKDQENIELN